MSKPQRSVVVLGDLEPLPLSSVREAARAVGATVLSHAGDAASTLDGDPVAMLVPMLGTGGFERCEQVRSDRRFAAVPLIVIGDARNSLSFGELFQSGGDDIVAPGDAASLARRLRAICTPASPRAGDAATRTGDEYAVVAGPASRWQTMVARALSNAGVPTHFVTTAAEAIAASVGAKAVVAAAGLEPSGAHVALAEARAAGSVTPWVIVAEPRRVPETVAAVQSLTRVAVVDSYAPPENALFVANELATSAAADNRSAHRLLYGTSVGFRAAGREEDDDVGFTYNVSDNGLFVRTLAPLAAGDDVWLELWAPRSSRRVRLAGKVAWRRHFGPDESATVPPGFGVHVTEGLAGDLERWRDGCALLQRDEARLRPQLASKMRPTCTSPVTVRESGGPR
jgi:Tfp pilus assembly protein PilZ/CheY-like chemotaxis protein